MYSSLIWDYSTKEKTVYLTFDDGPVPESTPWVLDLLKNYNLKATFFCIGENVVKHPTIFERILKEGHRVGNHTHTHVSGWKTDDKIYLEEIEKAAEYIESDLFRPPYGQISRSQARQVLPNYKVIMYDVVSGDFDLKRTAEDCYQNVTKNVESGSIIVFHDSKKAKERLHGCLERVLDFLMEKGYTMQLIP